jgi:hypothetical protein
LVVQIGAGPWTGREIVLTDERWKHIIDRHPELAHARRALEVELQEPYFMFRGRDPDEHWLYLKKVGPTRWLKIVVVWESPSRGLTITAFPRRMMP